MASSLSARVRLEWLRRAAKRRLESLRLQHPQARPRDARLDLARELGFPVWRELRGHFLRSHSSGRNEPTDSTSTDLIHPSDPDLERLLRAIEVGDGQSVERLLLARPALSRASGPMGQTPLHVAAQCNDPKLGAMLMFFGADAEARFGASGHTALSWALTCNAPEFARTLLNLGVRPDLYCAAGLGLVEEVQACFEPSGSIRPNASSTGSSRFAPDGTRLPCPPSDPREQLADALAFACRTARADIVELLIDRGADLAFRAYLGGTPLHWAYFGGSSRAIEALLRAGADQESRDDAFRATPRAFGIRAASSWGFPDLVRAQLARDPALAGWMDGQSSALHQAARAGHLPIVRMLLDAGADPNQLDGEGKTPLELADPSAHDQLAELLAPARGPGSALDRGESSGD